jgi:hypothetical protein
MKMRLLHQAVMVAMIGALPLAAGAAGNTTKGPEATSKGEQGKADINAGSTDRSANKDTDKQSASNNMGSASKSAKTNTPMHKSARKSSHASRSMAMNHASKSQASSHDTQYKAALRRCVTGEQSQRDSCIDQAIAQYGNG